MAENTAHKIPDNWKWIVITGGEGCRLDEQLFLDFTFNCNSRCVNGEGLLLFFQLLNSIGVYECITIR
ncbi:hypothetical protein COL44_15135 [Bacillus toyonensis]|nr:hypothetical protein COL44_15135 [Bacillus toyonensis]PHG44686.1 hypothetical protein COI57_22560 [Bacillus toyonensis]